ncbi:hypothetical protein CPB83DRAFT_855050 [Crepidotus variabilis]|uniref:F-box domain-containing protein n=1 Tax=Crepidotus variabilis TaxID=179855 RepID=A0A9P6EFZ0_9AGAR|nr:hypothetical protein CPB83DRAFT_855050 [Crepidotus variabilis]
MEPSSWACHFSKKAPCHLLAETDTKTLSTGADLDAAQWVALGPVNEKHDPMAYLLPLEISQNIFTHYLPQVPSQHLFDDPGVLDQLLTQATGTLISVNRHWRNIVYSTPQLWNQICVKTSATLLSTSHFARQLAHLELNFQRSRDFPLTIHLQMNYHDSDSLPANLQLLEMVCREAHRWENFHIAAPARLLSAIPKYTSQLNEGVPHLISLTLSSTYCRLLPAPEDWSLSIGSPGAPLPSPIYLTIWGVTITEKTFDLSRMTYFKPGTLTIPEVVHILSISPQLTSLTSYVRQMWFNHFVDRKYAQLPPSDLPFLHSSLKSLNVTMYVQRLFARITLPALENLHCSLDKDEYDALYEFLCRSRCPLKSLSLYLTCTGNRLIELLHLTPGLEELRVESDLTDVPDLASNFFQHFKESAERDGNGPTFLPQLRTLRFYVPSLTNSEFGLTMLQDSLWSGNERLPCRPLSKVTLDVGNDRQWTEAEQKDLLDLVQGGLEIAIHYVFNSEPCNMISNYPNIVKAVEKLQTKTRQ